MRKFYCILLCGFIILSVLGCADKDTFAGANREERIIMSLEKTYPEHTVHTIMYDNRYHFGCYDQYLVEIEKKGNFINKTAEIAKKHGYDIRYDEDNQTLALVIDVDHTVDTSDVTETIVEILNAAPTLPEIDYPDTTFSTGVENYFSEPEMYKLLYDFVTEGKNIVGIGDVPINQREEEKATIEEAVVEAYNSAMKNKESY